MAEQVPFTGYNKVEDVPTLVGNWVEERALKDLTGVARTMGATQSLTEQLKESGPTIHADALQATHPRVIEHPINQVHPADWVSHSQVSYQDPQTAAAQAGYNQGKPLGPREKMMLEAMKREAAAGTDEALLSVTGGRGLPPATQSVYGADFKQHDLAGMTIGARVMKDLDGRTETIKRDPTFLAEANITQKQLADRLFGDEPAKTGALQTTLLPSGDVPVTIYSEAVAAKTYGGTFAGTTTLNSASPFGKGANFSKPMSDYSKVVIDE